MRLGDRKMTPHAATGRLTWREVLFQGVVLFILLGVVFPRTFLHGEMITAASDLLKTPPWSEHRPPDYTPIQNWLPSDTIVVNSWMLLAQRAIENGEWPLWNHLQLAGTPLLANYQTRVFFPLRLLFCVFEYFVALTLYHLLVLWLCGMTAYLCGRVHGLGAGTSRFLSIGWMLSSFTLTWAYWPIPDEAAWLPILLIGTEFVLRGRYSRGFFALAFGATLLLLGGHPESAFAMGLGLGIYFLGRLVASGQWLVASRESPATSHQPLATSHFLKPLAVAGGAWVLALLVCAAQILPFVEYLPESHDVAERVHFASSEYSIPLNGIAAMGVPRFFGVTALDNYWGWRNSNFTMILYPGIAVWVCVACLAWARRPSPDLGKMPKPQAARGVVPSLAVASVLCLLIAFDFPISAPLKSLPPLSFTRQFWFAAFPMFALPFLAALGLERWCAGAHKPRALIGTILALGLLASVVLAVFISSKPTLATEGLLGYVQGQMLTAGILAAIAVALLVVQSWRPMPRLVVNAMTVLLAADLLAASWGLLPTAPRDQLFVQTPLVDRLKSLEQPSRVSALTAEPTVKPNSGMMPIFGVEELWGYDGIFPARFLHFLGECNRRAWPTMEPVCAIDHYLFRPNAFGSGEVPSGFEFETTLDGLLVYRNKRAFHRAFLVGQLVVVPDQTALFDTMCAPGFNPAQTAVTDAPPRDPVAPASPASEPGLRVVSGGTTAFSGHPQAPGTELAGATDLGTATVRERTSTRVVVDVDARRDCVLVLADAYYPGWKARIDDGLRPIFPVYHAFRGVVVSQGRHVVEYRYEPLSFRLGLAISVVSLLVGLFAVLRVLVRKGHVK